MVYMPQFPSLYEPTTIYQIHFITRIIKISDAFYLIARMSQLYSKKLNFTSNVIEVTFLLETILEVITNRFL